MADKRPVCRREFLALATIMNGAFVHARTPIESTEAVTLLFFATVKDDRAQEFARVAERLTKTSRAEDEGCIAYVFLQQQDDPREYVLYEQWRDRAALDGHLARLRQIFGPSSSGRGLPSALLAFFESTRTVRYRPVG